MIPYGRQSISEEDIKAVVEVLRSDFLTQGVKVREFEENVASYCGSNYGVAVNSATSALHLACLALGLAKGDSLWTTPITFVASANCAPYCGADIDFVDIDPGTFNMSVAALENKLSLAKELGKLPKIVIPVHLGGQSCDMEGINRLSKEYGFSVIEDASHAIGGQYRDHPIGNCRYSDIVIFSFHPVKLMTTGEGGVALTDDADLAESMRLLRSHGISRDLRHMDQAVDGPWYYQQVALGFNYRMTDIQAALGSSQLKRLDQFVKRRQSLASTYSKQLSELPLQPQQLLPECLSAFHLYIIRLNESLVVRHLEVFEHLRSRGVGVNLHYIPVHTQPYYRALGFKGGDFPEAEAYYASAISLPLYPELKNSEQQHVVNVLQEALA